MGREAWMVERERWRRILLGYGRGQVVWFGLGDETLRCRQGKGVGDTLIVRVELAVIYMNM